MGLFPDLLLSFWVCLLRCFCPKKVWFTNIPIVDRPRNPSSYSLESLQGLKWSSVSYFICLLKNCVSLCDNACRGQRTTLCGSLSHSPPFSVTRSLTELVITIQGSPRFHLSPLPHLTFTWVPGPDAWVAKTLSIESALQPSSIFYVRAELTAEASLLRL